ncbi:pitrilysin family protein [Longimicrobium sp.]|uniref:M16 family metallopeptidase n=1 Tax=Longimicrobium sp. TaxID=2029185 RepID=UPI002D0ED65E|nr:pitrilysin family protein [Longimicrobium sp.]HSU17273.1 pitrilysin family protein [Longimicrobium sp.]
MTRTARSTQRALLAACLLYGGAAQAQTGARPQPAPDVPTLPLVRYTLPNGMTALLSEDHSAPVVALTVWYHVGSKNEKPGRTGFAHLFEHMMFEGSENIGTGEHRRMIQSLGGIFNGSTTEDRTNYFEMLPSNQLETAIWMESDRMATLLTRLNQERLDAEREIVKNERRLRVDNQPFGVSDEVTIAALYPSQNPYSWPVIGSMGDLSAASLEDVRDFFRTYYSPGNATISISGDIDVARTRELLDRYFGTIPRGPAIERPRVAPTTLAAEKRLVLEDSRARLPQLQITWPTVGRHSPDVYALRSLGTLLTLDRTSRLRRVLVYDRQLATQVFARQNDNEDDGYFQIFVTPRPNASLTEIEGVIDSIVAAVQTAPLAAAEVQRVKNYTIVGNITGLQQRLARAETLAEGQVFDGDPLSYRTEIARQQAVTPADVQRVARRYLGRGRVVLSMVPAGKLDQVSRPSLPFTNVTPAAAAAPATSAPGSN